MSSDHHHHHHPTLHRRPTSNRNNHSPSSPPPPPPPPPSSKPNVTTTLYHTHIGIFALTWSKTLFGRSLHLHLLPSAAADDDDDSLSTTSSTTTTVPSFHLQIKPLIFWNKQGSKKIQISNNNKKDLIQIHYDLSRAKFGSGPEPISGFYIAATMSTQMILLIGDSMKQAYSKTKLSPNINSQITILRREHVTGISNKKYSTKATFRGKTREITIDCTRVSGDDSRLYFTVDGKKILVVKHLQWKFRGNERVETDGVNIQISWDVHNWLSNEDSDDGYALFMFRFEKSGFDYHEDDKYLARLNASGSGLGSGFGFGFEMKKMKKGMLKRAKSSSTSSSLSSASSGCGSVMEWESVEENELKGPNGFSLLVYAWKS
uniref:uncharacterized protein LOC122594675 n=1 Tax=Erigeron canadensis TaxID=72917 RepID=UPI001CB892F7|nr:uncharacterized protein LOC122594675 [Erigeron canadensis]